MDTLQLTSIIVLIAGVIASFLILLKWGWNFTKASRRTGVSRAMTLKEAILIAFFFPFVLACGTGAFWLYRIGWQGFTRTVMISLGFGLIWGVFMATLAYIGNKAGRRMAKKSVHSLK